MIKSRSTKMGDVIIVAICILLICICLLPMLISMLVIVAGPCIQNQDRYGFPIVYCMPLMLSCMSHVLSRKKECCEVSL